MPVLVMILLGIMEYGWFFSQQIAMVSAVRDSVRAGATTPQEWGPVAAAEQQLAKSLVAAGYTGTVYADVWLSGAAPDQLITVSASFPYRPLIGFVPSPDLVSSELVMRMEDQPDNAVADAGW